MVDLARAPLYLCPGHPWIESPVQNPLPGFEPAVSLSRPGRVAPEMPSVQASGRGRPGATVRARMPSEARSALSGMTGKIPASFQFCSIDDQS